MIKDVNSEILYNEQVSKEYYKMGLKTGWANFLPGQFLMIRVPDNVVFIRRPFSICRKVEGDGIEIFYKVVGPGTGRLKDLKFGEKLKVLGPLGKGFEVSKDIKRVIMVAGGFGIAPFVQLASNLSKKRVSLDLYYGGKGLEDIQFLDEFEEMGVKTHVTTEDGSLGTKGLVTEVLLKDVACHSRESGNPDKSVDLDPCFCRDDSATMIYCCGPEGMTDAVAKIAKDKKIPAQLSYETYMGCGIGVCLGCAVKTKDGYKRACSEGPVFDVEGIE